MVMHARKIPRLNDGYHDREQSHSYEDKNSSKHRHYNDRFGDPKRESSTFRHGSSSSEGRGARDRNDSPSGRSSPRYQNKSSYMDRNKDHATRGNSVDKRSNHDRSRGGKDSRNREQKQQDHRAEVRKSAMRVCGEWSEHVSSKGKCYYYNCKTEESKWEKPKEWTLQDEPRPKESKDRKMAQPSKKTLDDRPKHSSSTVTSDRYRGDPQENSRAAPTFGSPAATSRHLSQDSSAHQMAPPSSRSSIEHLQKYGRQNNSTNTNNGGQCSTQRTSSHGAPINAANRHGSDHSGVGEGSGFLGDRTFSTAEHPSHGYDRQHQRLNSSGSNASASWQGGHRGGNKSDYNGAKHHRTDDEDSRQAEDMDISPGSTPTDESLAALHALLPHSHPSASTPPASQKNSISSLLATLTSLTSSSGIPASELPALANLSALSGLVGTSPGGSSSATSPGAVLPQLLQQLTGSARASSHGTSAHGSKGGSQQVLQQAIHMLQKIQESLVAQQKQQQQRQMQQLLVAQLAQLQTQLQTQQQQQHHRQHGSTHHGPAHSHKVAADEGSQSPYSPPDESDGTPLQSPEYNNTGHHHHHHRHGEEAVTPTNVRSHPATGRESPRSDQSIKSSRRESPTHSHTSSQNMSSVGMSQLSAAHRKDESVHLTPSLANYYDESLIGHVSGLIYDHSERQSDCVARDAHVLGSELVTQLSADLKGARSLVRVGEIISTLHEQRILFIRQQIKDLDGWRTHSTFMPSSLQPPPGNAT